VGERGRARGSRRRESSVARLHVSSAAGRWLAAGCCEQRRGTRVVLVVVVEELAK